MIVRRNLKWSLILFYSWKGILYYLVLAIVVYVVHHNVIRLAIPFYTITAFGTALAIFLGFKNNSAYDRWWEARKLWGSLVNYSRAWTRQIITFINDPDSEHPEEVVAFQKKLIYRHIAYVNALRVFLRRKFGYNETGQDELFEVANEYHDTEPFLQPEEYAVFSKKNNPPNYLLEVQAEDLRYAFSQGWLSDYRIVKLEETLVEFNNVQGGCERIKNTPLLRHYSFYSRMFVIMHATMLPFAFVDEMGIVMIPISVFISFIFHSLDLVGERTEDPFENRLEDVPLTSLCRTIEANMKEQWGEPHLPAGMQSIGGIAF
jgi:putative membrane protein